VVVVAVVVVYGGFVVVAPGVVALVVYGHCVDVPVVPVLVVVVPVDPVWLVVVGHADVHVVTVPVSLVWLVCVLSVTLVVAEGSVGQTEVARLVSLVADDVSVELDGPVSVVGSFDSEEAVADDGDVAVRLLSGGVGTIGRQALPNDGRNNTASIRKDADSRRIL